ncbi:hypothetical protein JTB14_032324 [Gonioctena quinquepunctata]|nr:hypothetical protein JTB14_032324 [Gonioctena quinquepunctata]
MYISPRKTAGRDHKAVPFKQGGLFPISEWKKRRAQLIYLSKMDNSWKTIHRMKRILDPVAIEIKRRVIKSSC